MKTKSNDKGRQAFVLKLSVEPVACRFGRERRAAGPLHMIFLYVRCIPEDHHCVSDEFINGTALREKSLSQNREMPGSLMHQSVGVGAFRYSGEIPDISKQDCHFLTHSAKPRCNRAIDNALDDLLWNKVGERPNRPLRECHYTAQLLDFG